MEQHEKWGNSQAIDSVNMRPTHRVQSLVQVDYGTTEWFHIQKGVRQGRILSPGLFNVNSDYIIKTGGVGNKK